jgi:hypothetical protein
MPALRVLSVLILAVVLAAPADAAGAERARLAWSAAGADVDLHVFDGHGHRAWYRDPDGIPDAALSRDVTRGPGEEVLSDARAPSARRLAFGACYYASHDAGPAPAVTVSLTLTDAGGGRRVVEETLAAPGAHALLDAGGGVADAAIAAGGWCDVPGKDAPPSREASAPRAGALARRFRPRLYFDSSERWRPLAATALLGERVGARPAHAVCRPARPLSERPDRCAPGTSAPVVGPASLRAADRDDAVLDLGADGRTTPPRRARSPDPACAGVLHDCDAGPAAGIHHRVVRSGGYLLLDYWLLYRYSDAPYSVAGLPGPGRLLDTDHEGDWEGVAVAVPADDPDPRTFDWVAYAAHAGPPRRYLRAALSCDGDVSAGSCADPGALRPHVYVAAGTHASYPMRCRDRGVAAFGLPGAGRTVGRYVLGCRQRGGGGPLPAGLLPEGGHDGARRWGADDDPAALRPLALDDGFTNWSGRWGLPGATRSPARQWDARARASGPAAASGPTAASARSSAMAGDATTCADWLGEQVAVAVCDERVLQAAFAAGTLGRPGAVTLAGGTGRPSASAPGIAQLGGGPLAAGERVTVLGAPEPGSVLVARALGDAGASEVVVPLGEVAPGGPVTVRAADDAPASLFVRDGAGRTLPAVATARGPRPPRRLTVRRRGAAVRVSLRAAAARTIVELRDGTGAALRLRRLRTRPGRRATVRMPLPRRARTVAAASARGGITSAAVVRRIGGRR